MIDPGGMFDVIQPDAIYDAMWAVFTFKTLFWLSIGVTIAWAWAQSPGSRLPPALPSCSRSPLRWTCNRPSA